MPILPTTIVDGVRGAARRPYGRSLVVGLLAGPIVPLVSAGWGPVHRLPVLPLERDVPTAVCGAGGYIGQAMATLEVEQKEVRAERDAFWDFAHKIESMPIGSVATPVPQAATLTVGRDEKHQPSLEGVRDTFKDTVMAVPHFPDEYGESLAVHMAAEFTSDIATAVGEGDQLSRPLKQALITQAVAASRD